MSIESGQKHIETVGELVEALVEYIERKPDSANLPVGVYHLQEGLVRPITALSDEDTGLMVYTNDEYAQVHSNFRTIPDSYNYAGRINRLLEFFTQLMREPANQEKMQWEWGYIRGVPRIVIKRRAKPELSGLKKLAIQDDMSDI